MDWQDKTRLLHDRCSVTSIPRARTSTRFKALPRDTPINMLNLGALPRSVPTYPEGTAMPGGT
jgi:hypothetical protein